ncbi:MAG: hypothetical protein PHH51_03245 [Bacilli bacterium]|nr:hypothetical protein [Bacilli bacterium]MDD3896018.1 hypothetical protein [Bacilli bacterium]MDD4407678.1 hypothetical protein [Bacilli bacterium]
MNNIKENKITIIICVSLIAIALLITYFIDNNIFSKNEYKAGEEFYLKNYKINEITPINMNEEQIARKYLAEYTKLILTDPEVAYDLVDKDYREKKFGSLNKFKEYFNEKFDVNFFNGQIEKYNVNKTSKYKEFYLIDSSDNTYIFREYSIMQYKVLFDNYTV